MGLLNLARYEKSAAIWGCYRTSRTTLTARSCNTTITKRRQECPNAPLGSQRFFLRFTPREKRAGNPIYILSSRTVIRPTATQHSSLSCVLASTRCGHMPSDSSRRVHGWGRELQEYSGMCHEMKKSDLPITYIIVQREARWFSRPE
jgi:hypothetical protein